MNRAHEFEQRTFRADQSMSGVAGAVFVVALNAKVEVFNLRDVFFDIDAALGFCQIHCLSRQLILGFWGDNLVNNHLDVFIEPFLLGFGQL